MSELLSKEKAKQEVSRFPRKQFWGCMGTFAFACIGIYVIFVFLAPIFNGQILRTSLAPAAIPTAEALLTLPSKIIDSPLNPGWEHFWYAEDYNLAWINIGYEDIICIDSKIDSENY